MAGKLLFSGSTKEKLEMTMTMTMMSNKTILLDGSTAAVDAAAGLSSLFMTTP